MGDDTPDSEWQADIARSEKRRREFKQYLEKALADPDNKFRFDEHPFPWTARMAIWDGPGVQFFDANGKPVMGDLFRDQDDAATLLDLCNTLGALTLSNGDRASG